MNGTRIARAITIVATAMFLLSIGGRSTAAEPADSPGSSSSAGNETTATSRAQAKPHLSIELYDLNGYTYNAIKGTGFSNDWAIIVAADQDGSLVYLPLGVGPYEPHGPSFLYVTWVTHCPAPRGALVTHSYTVYAVDVATNRTSNTVTISSTC